MQRSSWGWRVGVVLVLALLTPVAAHASESPQAAGGPASVPGQWGTTDTSKIAPEDLPAWWPGERNIRGQWFKILPDDFDRDQGDWDKGHHVKAEPPHNLYYLWRADKPMPEGTKFLLEGDFPHARFMDIQVIAPNQPGVRNTGDGSGIPEVPLADVDIEPDPGHFNPFRPNPYGRAVPDDKRHWHVSIELKDGDPVALNTFGGRSAMLPPYRAPGNLRVGGTFMNDGEAGPEIYVRMYLPDQTFDNDGNIYGDEAYAGIEPPVLRIQYPGQEPEIAPPTRRSEYNYFTRRQNDKPYTLEENPVLHNSAADPWEHDRSLKELEALKFLRDFGHRETEEAGAAGERSIYTHAMWNAPDGTVDLYKVHAVDYYTNYFIGGGGVYTSGIGCLVAQRLSERDGRGPKAPPPGNDEHASGQSLYNSYLGSKVSITPGVLLVMRGKMPATPRTMNGAQGAPPGDQRYWSELDLRYFSIDLLVGSTVNLTSVVDLIDEDIVVDEAGNYTIVFGRPQDKPSPETIAEHDITFRPWTIGREAAVVMRMATTGTYDTAQVWERHPQHITWADMNNYCSRGNPLALRARMGPYAPILRYLTTDNIAAGEWDAPNPYDPISAAELEAQSSTVGPGVVIPWSTRWR